MLHPSNEKQPLEKVGFLCNHVGSGYNHYGKVGW
jgi:hypothetical protein